MFVALFMDWVGTGGGSVDLPSIEGIPDGVGAFDLDTGVSGWDALTSIDGFLIILAGAAGLTLGGLAATGRRLNLGSVPHGATTAVLGTLATALILWKIAGPGSVEFGMIVGLAAAVAVATGAVMTLGEGGYKLLSTAPARTKATRAIKTSSSAKAAPAKRTAKAAPKPAAKTAKKAAKQPAARKRAAKKPASRAKKK